MQVNFEDSSRDSTPDIFMSHDQIPGWLTLRMSEVDFCKMTSDS